MGFTPDISQKVREKMVSILTFGQQCSLAGLTVGLQASSLQLHQAVTTPSQQDQHQQQHILQSCTDMLYDQQQDHQYAASMASNSLVGLQP
jgi:hypothetical protein